MDILSTDMKDKAGPKAGDEAKSISVPTNLQEARQKLEEWIDKDLAKSGLTRDDMEVIPFCRDSYQKQDVRAFLNSGLPFSQKRESCEYHTANGFELDSVDG